MTSYEVQKAANAYSDKIDSLHGPRNMAANDAFIAGVVWARSIADQPCAVPVPDDREAKIEPSMSAQSLMAEFQSVRDVITDLSCTVVDVGQKVEAIMSMVADEEELPEDDRAYAPAVGMFGIGGDAGVSALVPPKVTALRPGVVMGLDRATGPDKTAIGIQDEGRVHPIEPPKWAGRIVSTTVLNGSFIIACEHGVFIWGGGSTLHPLQFAS